METCGVSISFFPGYLGKLEANQQKTGLRDAVITGTGKLHGRTIALGVMDFGFNGGSMGSVVGEKLTRVIEKATSRWHSGHYLLNKWWGS